MAAEATDRPALPAGYRLVALESVDSTNDEACRLARGGAGEGTVVWARRQTAGRGRRGRGWDSPAGNLYCSFVLRPAVAAPQAAQLTFVAALALGAAVGELLPETVDMRYKWPNDLLLDGRKVAGILLDSAGAGQGPVDWLVAGIGVNVARHPEVTDRYPATSLRAVGAAAEPADLLDSLVRNFAAWYGRWRADGLAPVREAWLARAAGIGETVEVRLPGRSRRGRFDGLDEAGALVLGLPDGTTAAIPAGDVFF